MSDKCGKRWRISRERRPGEHEASTVEVECERERGHEGRCYGWTPRLRRPSGLLAEEP